MKYVTATGGKHCQRLLWHLAAASESHEPQYIIYLPVKENNYVVKYII